MAFFWKCRWHPHQHQMSSSWLNLLPFPINLERPWVWTAREASAGAAGGPCWKQTLPVTPPFKEFKEKCHGPRRRPPRRQGTRRRRQGRWSEDSEPPNCCSQHKVRKKPSAGRLSRAGLRTRLLAVPLVKWRPAPSPPSPVHYSKGFFHGRCYTAGLRPRVCL